MKFTKDEYLDAVQKGVKEAFMEKMNSANTIRIEQITEQIRYGVEAAFLTIIDDDEDNAPILQQIRQGVQDAIWKIATNATGAPCADFYDHIKLGVKEAFEFTEIPCCCHKEESNEIYKG